MAEVADEFFIYYAPEPILTHELRPYGMYYDKNIQGAVEASFPHPPR